MLSEIALLVSITGTFFAIFFSLKNSKKTDTEEIARRASEMAGINIKLDHIALSTKEIKEQIASLVKDVQDHGQRIAKVEELAKRNEEAIKRLHARVDELAKGD